MNWINTGGAAALLLISACASQAPVIPEDGEDMLTIYRRAMAGDAHSGVAPFTDEADALCAQLPVEANVQECTELAQAILATQRLAIAANPDDETLDYLPYTRAVQSEIEQVFPRLPNPDLVIYIYPHLATRTRAPIPGYTTVIPLFDRIEYQLPGEIPPLD